MKTYTECPICGSYLHTSIGYSMPATYMFHCNDCDWCASACGDEQIKVLTFEEGIKKRPQLYIDHFMKENSEMRIMLQSILHESLECEDTEDFMLWVQENLDGHPLLKEPDYE